MGQLLGTEQGPPRWSGGSQTWLALSRVRSLSDRHFVVIVMGIRAGFGMEEWRDQGWMLRGAFLASLPPSLRTSVNLNEIREAHQRFDACLKDND